MSGAILLAPFFAQLDALPILRWEGRVTQVLGQVVESEGPACAVGECCLILDPQGQAQPGEIVGFRGSSFEHLNLLDSRRMSTTTDVDVIFCRNVLVYYDVTAKAQVLERFHNSLSPGGILFLGPAESLFGVTTKLSLIHLPCATAYAKTESQLAGRFLP